MSTVKSLALIQAIRSNIIRWLAVHRSIFNFFLFFSHISNFSCHYHTYLPTLIIISSLCSWLPLDNGSDPTVAEGGVRLPTGPLSSPFHSPTSGTWPVTVLGTCAMAIPIWGAPIWEQASKYGWMDGMEGWKVRLWGEGRKQGRAQ